MTQQQVGFLHPGAMGISLAVSAQNSGHTAFWVSTGRSAQSHERAEHHGLQACASVRDLCERCSIIISVCPPHAAMDVADAVLAASFSGIYADVNAIAPQRSRAIAEKMTNAGVTFVDGGIIGGPAWKADATWLYLSGEAADQVAPCFDKGPLETQIIGTDIGKASALKMCFAANSKGTTALICGILATAEQLGVRDELMQQWSRHGSSFAADAERRATVVTAKAWRFAGEMHEIADTLHGAGLPDGFHRAAADVYQRMAGFKDAAQAPSIEAVLQALLRVEE